MGRTKPIVAMLLTAVAVVIPFKASGQTPTIPAELLKDWQAQKTTMMKIADAMPAEKFGYRSTPPQRSYGEQILHVAGANVWLMGILKADVAPPFEANPRDLQTFGLGGKTTDKAAILKALSDAFDYGEAVMKKLSPAAMTEVVQGPPWIGQATRAKMVWYTMGHTQDIYGQMAVYLRLNGLVPPASQRGGI